MAIEYTPKETSNLVNKISEGGAFQTSGGQELSTSKSFASKSVAASRDAATSEANAQSSETASAANASASSASASSSATSATASASSSSAAATSETAAELAETNAETAETSAISSASLASTSETNAATSETNAATSEANAATSETNAATSEANAAASYDSFDDRYLGPKPSAPTLNNDDDALIAGSLYFNSTSNLMKVWSGSLWLDAFAPSGTVSWGTIGGVLADQTDLQAYIDTMLPLAGGAVTGPITTNSTFDGRDVSVDGTKLDGVEALADVTDTTNVVAALTAGNGVDISEGGVVAVSVVALTTVQTAVSETAHLALSTQEGDVVVRSDLEQTFMHNGGSAGTIADFTLLTTPTDSVTSVDGLTGVVTLNHDSLAGFVANEHVDYTAGGTFGGDIDVTGRAVVDGLTSSASIIGTSNSNSLGGTTFTSVISTVGLSSSAAITSTSNSNIFGGTSFTSDIDVTGTATMDGLSVNGATVLDVGDEGTLQVGPTNTVADENQTFEMRGSNGSNELQRFQITNRGETGTVDFKFGRAGATPTNVISIGPTGTTTMNGVTVKNPNVSGEQTILKIENAVSTGTIGNITFNQTDDRMGISNETSGSLAFDTAAVERMRIDSTGNVGIGITTPDATLEVNVTTSGSGANANTAGSSFGIGSTGTTQPILGMRWTGASHVGISGNAFSTQIVNDTVNSNALEMYTTGASPIVFGTSSTERMRIDDSGINVTGAVTVTRSDVATDNSTISNEGGLFVISAAEGGGGGNYPMLFKTVNTERMRIDSTGNVGIGTSSPKEKVSIQSGNLRFQSSSDVAINTVVGEIIGSPRPTAPEGSGMASIKFISDATTWHKGVISFCTNNLDGTDASNPPLERMRIDAAGNLLVGTLTSANPESGFTVTSEGGTKLQINHANGTASGVAYATFRYNQSTVGSITQNGTSATLYSTSSDYRLKDITGPLQGSGDYIDSLNPVEGTWKLDGSVFVGLIAHEADEVSRTKIATGEKDGEEMQSMDYSSAEMIANLIKEVQSLRKRVLQLEGS